MFMHVLFGVIGALIGWLLTRQYWQSLYNNRESVIVDRNRQNRILSDDVIRLTRERKAYEKEVEREIELLQTQIKQQSSIIANIDEQRNQETESGAVASSAKPVAEKATYDPYLDMTQDQLEGRDNPDDIYPLLQSETIQDYITAIRDLEEENAEIADDVTKAKKKYKVLRKKYNTLLDEHGKLSSAYKDLDKKKAKKVVKRIAVKEYLDIDKLRNLLQENMGSITKKEIKNITTEKSDSKRKSKK